MCPHLCFRIASHIFRVYGSSSFSTTSHFVVTEVAMLVESSILLRNVKILHCFDKALYLLNDSQGCCLHCVIPSVEMVAIALAKLLNRGKSIR